MRTLTIILCLGLSLNAFAGRSKKGNEGPEKKERVEAKGNRVAPDLTEFAGIASRVLGREFTFKMSEKFTAREAKEMETRCNELGRELDNMKDQLQKDSKTRNEVGLLVRGMETTFAKVQPRCQDLLPEASGQAKADLQMTMNIIINIPRIIRARLRDAEGEMSNDSVMSMIDAIVNAKLREPADFTMLIEAINRIVDAHKAAACK